MQLSGGRVGWPREPDIDADQAREWARPTRGAGFARSPAPRHDEVRRKETPLMRSRRPWLAGAAVPALALALVGCGATGSATSSPSAAAKQCGSGRTAAGVRVLIEISRGSVACSAA